MGHEVRRTIFAEGNPVRNDHALNLSSFCHCAGVLLATLLLVFAVAPSGFTQTRPGPPQPLITQPINENNLVVLVGNTRPEAQNPANDRGLVADDMPLPHLMLQLRRPAAREQALETLIDQLHDPKSPNYHRWLTAAEIGEQYGVAPSDIDTIGGWLSEHGFTVDSVYTNRLVIDFSGTAGQIRTAFHTEIHNLSVDGIAHIANMTDPQIPAALAPAIIGPVSLNDFKPRPASGGRNYSNSGDYYMTPPDLATIYNFNPVFASGISGQGQSIYLLESANIYAVSDWTTFRSNFGLSGYTDGSLTTIHPPPPSGANNCTDPGSPKGSRDQETTLDAEWASAAAPSAAIVIASCADTATNWGGLYALQNLVNAVNPPHPTIMTVTIEDCEAYFGAATNAAYNMAYQTGVAAGMSIYVAAGDFAEAQCDGSNIGTHGIGVNGYASSPYVVAVGGTDFGDTYLGENSSYWNSSNGPTHGSAKSYIPEIPWNSSCGSELSAAYNGYSATYSSGGFCNSSLGESGLYATAWGGSGGPSGCATGSPSIPGVVSGSCMGYPKPSWQTGVIGIPNDGVRDLPDVSLFSSGAPWLHSYIYCFSDPNYVSTPCSSNPNTWWYGAWGTSFATPIWAGIQALLDQTADATYGNPNYQLYGLAAEQYGAAGSFICNSSRGNTVSGLCIFYDVTLGDNDAPCQADTGTYYNCFLPSGTNGVMSTSNSSYQPAYKAATGWDFATGIGTVNVANLVKYFSTHTYYGLTVTDTHDINGDGYSDIVWRDTAGDTSIWLMTGAQVSSSGGIGTVPTTWLIVGQRDFNGDGDADLLWRDSSGNTSIWFMNGMAVASSVSVGNIPTDWSVAGVADFNGDGLGDLLWRDSAGDLAVWLMNGASVLSTGSLGNIATNWSVAATGDFNGDGKADILWRDSSGNTSIWFMNGTTVGSTAVVGNISTTWSVVGTGDFNGDGKTDVVWRDTSGNTSIWLMSGASVLSAGSLGNVPTTFTMVQTGDYNGDGMSDLLWRYTGGVSWNGTSGNTGIWFMNGTAVASTADLGNIPLAWTVQSVNAE
jgi:hypothetical protein